MNKDKSVLETEQKLAAMTAQVAKLRAEMETAAGNVRLAELAVADASRILPADPTPENHKNLKSAKETLEKTRAILAEAEKAWRTAHNEEELQSAQHLRQKQTALARQLILEKKAQKNPEIMELLEESKAKGVAIDGLREKLASAEAALVTTNESLAAATKRAAELATQLERTAGDLAKASAAEKAAADKAEDLEKQLAKAKKDLAAAMKAKPEAKAEAGA